MNKFDPDNIYLDFLAQLDIKYSRFLILEIIFPIICGFLVIGKWQIGYKKIEGNGKENNFEYLNIKPQKLLECDSNYDNDFYLGIIRELLRKIYIENLNYIGCS